MFFFCFFFQVNYKIFLDNSKLNPKFPVEKKSQYIYKQFAVF